MKKNRVYIWMEDDCLAWEIKTRTGGQTFGASIDNGPAGVVFRNFQWEMPVCTTLRELLGYIADRSFEYNDLLPYRGRPRQRMDVEKIRVKPWQEESYERIVKKLRPINKV